MRATICLTALLTLPFAAPFAGADDRILQAEVLLDAPVEKVWRLWTTEEGVKSFFAPACSIDLRVDGVYGIYFNPAAEPGKRGADAMRILVLEPMRRFSFTWNAPLAQPAIRAQRTVVMLELSPAEEGRTRLRLTHSGWGAGEEWDDVYRFFDRAWNAQVLPRLVYRLAQGPVDWANQPDLKPVQDTMMRRVVTEPFSAEPRE